MDGAATAINTTTILSRGYNYQLTSKMTCGFPFPPEKRANHCSYLRARDAHVVIILLLLLAYFMSALHQRHNQTNRKL